MKWLEVMKLDMYDPITKLKKVNEIQKVNFEIIDYIISSLYSFDMYLQEYTRRTENYYMLDDMSLINILNEKFPEIELKKHIIIIDNVKLIYRFTVAKKFHVKDTKTKQLRLNSWGKEYYGKIDLEIKKNTEDLMKKYMLKNRLLYKKIISEFSKEKLDTEIISNINEKLLVKIVF